MLIVALGIGLTAVLLVKVGYHRGIHATERGWMSQRWIAAYNASQPSESG